MHLHSLSTCSHLDSPIHRLPAPVKLFADLTLILIILTLPLRYFPWLAAIAILLLTIALASHIPGRFLLKRLLFLEPFVIGVSLLTLFQPHGYTLFLVILTRSTLCLFTMILLANTTPFHEMLATLKRLHFPALILTTLALMHRYLDVLLEESQRMRRARASRTFVKRHWLNWGNLASVAGQLFLRSSRRAERIYAAMCARGWK